MAEEPSWFDRQYEVLREWRQRRSSQEQLALQLVRERATGKLRVELRVFEKEDGDWWPSRKSFWLSKKEVRSICRMVARQEEEEADGQDQEADEG